MTKHEYTVSLNGTKTNPYHKFGLTQNPFPQLAKMETDLAERAINKLGGEPIPHNSYAKYIRDTLEGKVSEELIKLCISKFKPRDYITFTVSWMEK